MLSASQHPAAWGRGSPPVRPSLPSCPLVLCQALSASCVHRGGGFLIPLSLCRSLWKLIETRWLVSLRLPAPSRGATGVPWPGWTERADMVWACGASCGGALTPLNRQGCPGGRPAAALRRASVPQGWPLQRSEHLGVRSDCGRSAADTAGLWARGTGRELSPRLRLCWP